MFRKTGTTGKIIDVQKNFAKLGAKYTCSKCGRSCVAATTQEVTTKVCPTCR